jgi:hypothetical protein
MRCHVSSPLGTLSCASTTPALGAIRRRRSCRDVTGNPSVSEEALSISIGESRAKLGFVVPIRTSCSHDGDRRFFGTATASWSPVSPSIRTHTPGCGRFKGKHWSAYDGKSIKLRQGKARRGRKPGPLVEIPCTKLYGECWTIWNELHRLF